MRDAQDISFGITKVLMTWILRNRLRFLHFHPFRVSDMDFNNASKFRSCISRQL